MQALADRPDLVWPLDRLTVPLVTGELAGSDPPLLLGVRDPREWTTKHIDGSMNVPLSHLRARRAYVAASEETDAPPEP